MEAQELWRRECSYRLHMASTAMASEIGSGDLPANTPTSSPAPMRMLPLVLLMILTVVLTVGGVAGTLVYLASSGRLAAAAHAIEPAAGSVTNAAPAAMKTHAIVLDPMLVNLADADGHSYLRVALTLQVQDLVPAKGEKAAKAEPETKDGSAAANANAPARDTLLDVLGRQRGEDLLAPDGKERLKVMLKAALAERNPEMKVVDIYITEFLVQR
jgi:flagellar FliL protein